MTTKPDDIPRNPNSIENGLTDPTPEAGKGGAWRALISWLKGWAPEKTSTPADSSKGHP